MLYFPTNVLLHDSCFSKNYDSSPSSYRPDNTYLAYPLGYAMDSDEPDSFLPAYFPSPAPKLALSRPGTQQYAPMPYIGRTEQDSRSSHAHAEGYKIHHPSPLPGAEQYVPIPGPYHPNHHLIERTEQDRSAHAYYYKNYPLPAGQHRDLNPVYPQPPYAQPPYAQPQAPYAQSPCYNNFDELSPLYNARPAYESTSLYGLYVQSESHTGPYTGGLCNPTGSSSTGADKHADSSAHTANRHARHGPPLPPELHIRSVSGTASTPVLYRMSAKRLPGDQSYIPAPQLESCLKKDLEGNVIFTIPTFFLDNLWPISTLPCPLDEHTIFKALEKNKAWDAIHDCFVTPPLSITEYHMAEWLNTLGGLIGAFTGSGFERKRSWSASTHSRPPAGATINRKPDLVLVDRSFVDKPPDGLAPPHISWTHVDAFAEVTRSYPFPKRIYSTINDKSYLLFVSQHDRRFVPALSFNGQGLFALTLTDRQGQISMPPIPFLHGKANAFMFMKILTFLMYGPVHNAGRDTTMELHSNGHVKSISVNNHWYNVVYLIYSLQSMIGRGTTVWLVKRNGEYYILKDSWIQDSRVESEISFLKKLKDDPKLKNHVPDLIEGEDIRIDGAVDSTGRYRVHIGGMHDSRGHRRLVMSPIGKQITTFQSKCEFILAIIDIIEGKLPISFLFLSNLEALVLKHLHERHQMLHRDISPNNLLLIRPSVEGGVRSGMLIDFDYAALTQALGSRLISNGFRTVRIFDTYVHFDLLILHHSGYTAFYGS
jgi:hypothetical protein